MSRRTSSTLLAAVAGFALLLGSVGPAAADTDSPLRSLLERKRVALTQTEAKTAQQIETKTTAESRSGVRRLRIGDFQFLSDSDRGYAGYNLGAGSWDTFVAVVASAIADEFVIQAAALKIPVDAIDVIFTSRPDTPEQAKAHKVSYPRNLGYVAYIDSPASEAQLEELRQAVERNSAVLAVVRDSQPIGHGKVQVKATSATPDPDQPPGLRDFLVEKRQAILRRQERRNTGTPPQPTGLRAHAHVEPHSGLRSTRTGTSNFQFLHDSGSGQLGIAPTAEQHQIGVLGTCLTHIFEIEAAKAQLVLDSLELKTEATLTPRGVDGAPPRFKDIAYSVEIGSPAPAAKIDELRSAVEGSCPIYNLLKDSQPIDGRIVRERYKGQDK